MLRLFVGLVSLLFTFAGFAHPVIYKDGIVASSFNMSSYSDNQLLYTFSPKWATGLNHWRFTKGQETTELGLARLNYLLWRRNAEDSQANLYILSGAGTTGTREAYMGGLEADWETRTLYTALKYYHFSSPAFSDIAMTQARIGISPYEAGFEQLQTWFMLQAMTMPKIEPKVVITPMLRFFYKNVLWEFGSSTRGDWMLNLMVHY